MAPPWLPLLSSDHGFESDRSSASTSSSVASMSEGLGGSRCSCCGQWPCREPRGHRKINLPVFKDEDTKDAIMYQSWHWDLTMYNNVKALDALNQGLFQLCMGNKETVSDWGVCLSRHLQVLMVSFPEHFPPDCVAKLMCDHFYGGLPKWLKAMVAYLKASMNENMYSKFLWVVKEAEKEEVMETLHNWDS